MFQRTTLFSRFAWAGAIAAIAGASSLGAQSTDGAGDREAVLATARAMLTAISTRDTALAHRQMQPGMTLSSTADPIAPTTVARVTTDTAFLRGIGSSPNRLLERMWEPQALMAGTVALVYAPYDFHIDGKFSHCGTDTFTLVKTPQGWRITHLAYTVQRAGCAPSPLGPPPADR